MPDYIDPNTGKPYRGGALEAGTAHLLGTDNPGRAGGLIGGMIGGLPEGLNPMAIAHMLKQEGLPYLEEAGASLAPQGVGKAAKDLGGSAIAGLKRAAERAGHMSEGRWGELMQRFGGQGK